MGSRILEFGMTQSFSGQMDGTSGTGMGLKPPKPGSFGIWGPPTKKVEAKKLNQEPAKCAIAENPPVVSQHAFDNYTELAHALWQPPASIQEAHPHGFRLSVRRVASAVGPSSRGKSSCTRSTSARVPCLPPCPPPRP